MPRDKVLCECDNCHYQTNKKSHYEDHIKRNLSMGDQNMHEFQRTYFTEKQLA